MNYCASQKKWPVLDFLFLNRKYRKWAKKHGYDVVQYGDVEPEKAYWPLVDFPIYEDPNDQDADGIYPEKLSELHPFPLQCRLKGGGREKGQNNVPRRTRRRRPAQQRKPANTNGIPRNLRRNDIMPPAKKVTLNFFDPLMQISAPTQSFVIKSIRINDLFDPDPAVLTSGFAGFANLMTFYEFYRVDKAEVSWRPANNEAFQIAVGYVFSQINLNAGILTRQDAIDALENGISTGSQTLQNRNGGRSEAKLNRFIKCKSLLGNPQLYEGDISYTGTVSSSPPDQLWVNLIVISPTNLTLLLNGTVGVFELRCHSTLFGRVILNDPLLARKKKTVDDLSVEELRDALVAKVSEKQI